MELSRRSQMVSAKFPHPNKREKNGGAPIVETSCFSCGLTFIHQQDYKDHIRLFHDAKDANLWRLCDDCGKLFSSESSLADHYADHAVAKILCALDSYDWSTEPSLDESTDLQSTSEEMPVKTFKQPYGRSPYGRHSENHSTRRSVSRNSNSGRQRRPKDPDYDPSQDLPAKKEWRRRPRHLPRPSLTVAPLPTPNSQIPPVKNKRGRPRKHPIAPFPLKMERRSPSGQEMAPVIIVTEPKSIPVVNGDSDETAQLPDSQPRGATPNVWRRERKTDEVRPTSAQPAVWKPAGSRPESGVASPPISTAAAPMPYASMVGRKRKYSATFSAGTPSSAHQQHGIEPADVAYLTNNRHMFPAVAALPLQRSSTGTMSLCPLCQTSFAQPPQLVQHMLDSHHGKLDLIEKVTSFSDEKTPERKLLCDSETCEFCSEMFPCKTVCLQHVMVFHDRELNRCPPGAKSDVRFDVLLGQNPMSAGEKYNVMMSLMVPNKRLTDG